MAWWPGGLVAGWPGGRVAGWPVGRVAGGRVADWLVCPCRVGHSLALNRQPIDGSGLASVRTCRSDRLSAYAPSRLSTLFLHRVQKQPTTDHQPPTTSHRPTGQPANRPPANRLPANRLPANRLPATGYRQTGKPANRQTGKRTTKKTDNGKKRCFWLKLEKGAREAWWSVTINPRVGLITVAERDLR